ncbi:Uncharacterized protein FKW44_018657 [Caligus rogercresseyi]|uniref:Uncharacterized protein n=1 Tax=Caligus rogercresseyi TaxID=217165 RepID=A0A7T8GUQ6_CALRO|nr:Uncharacterized protein FKW44_018657 [Caligus rogercresseyi]
MTSLKIVDVLTRFNGTGEVEIWIKQAELAKTLLGIEDLATIIPLFLDGKAFAVYDQLDEEGKKDTGTIFSLIRSIKKNEVDPRGVN